MLEHLGHPDAELAIAKAIERGLSDESLRTADFEEALTLSRA